MSFDLDYVESLRNKVTKLEKSSLGDNISLELLFDIYDSQNSNDHYFLLNNLFVDKKEPTWLIAFNV